MEVMIISATTPDGARTQIEAGLNKIASVIGPPPMSGAARLEPVDGESRVRPNPLSCDTESVCVGWQDL